MVGLCQGNTYVMTGIWSMLMFSFFFLCFMSESGKISVHKEILRYGMTASIHSIFKVRINFL